MKRTINYCFEQFTRFDAWFTRKFGWFFSPRKHN